MPHAGYVGTRFDSSNSAFQGESPNPDVPSQAQKSLLAHHPHTRRWPPADRGGQTQVQSIPGEHPEDTGTSAAPGKLASVPCTTAALLERRNRRAPQCKAAASATRSPTVQTAFRINYPSRPLWARGKILLPSATPQKGGIAALGYRSSTRRTGYGRAWLHLERKRRHREQSAQRPPKGCPKMRAEELLGTRKALAVTWGWQGLQAAAEAMWKWDTCSRHKCRVEKEENQELPAEAPPCSTLFRSTG